MGHGADRATAREFRERNRDPGSRRSLAYSGAAREVMWSITRRNLSVGEKST